MISNDVHAGLEKDYGGILVTKGYSQGNAMRARKPLEGENLGCDNSLIADVINTMCKE